MKKINHSLINSFRNPNQLEIEKISQWVYLYNSSNIKIGKITSTILAALGTIFIISSTSSSGSSKILFCIVGVFCYLITYSFIRYKKKRFDINIGYEHGEFVICDGLVSKIETNIDTPGCINVWFLSKDQQFNDGWYRVRKENIEKGSPLLLVIPNSERTKKFSPIAFSEFMLTDEGIKLHW